MYSKGVSRYSYYLVLKGNIKNPNPSETYENRFANRFRIFDKCFFLKRLDYQTYLSLMKEFHNETEVHFKNKVILFIPNKIETQMEKIKELFSKAQKVFQELTNEESFENAKLKSDAKKLARVKRKIIKFFKGNFSCAY